MLRQRARVLLQATPLGTLESWCRCVTLPLQQLQQQPPHHQQPHQQPLTWAALRHLHNQQQRLPPLSECRWPGATESAARRAAIAGGSERLGQAACRHLHSQQQQQQQQHSQQPPAGANVLKLYRGNWIIAVRFLVRAKVFQLMGGGSIGLVLGTLAMDDASLSDVFALAALAGGMVAASCCLWYYSRRYVGEMGLLLPDRTRVRFSVLDFWGNRENVDVPVSAIVPPFRDARPKEVDRLASQLLFPVNVTGQQRQFYLSIHAGHIMQPQIFFQILKGSDSADSGSSSSQAPAGQDQQQQPMESLQPCQQQPLESSQQPQQQQPPALKSHQAEPPPPPTQRMW